MHEPTSRIPDLSSTRGSYFSLAERRQGNHTSLNLESLLWQRQMMGGTSVRPSVLTSQLSAKAWSQDRMHNMILACGPGTPASVLHAHYLKVGAREESADSQSDPHSSSDSEDDQLTWTRLGHNHDCSSSDDEDDEDLDEEQNNNNQTSRERESSEESDPQRNNDNHSDESNDDDVMQEGSFQEAALQILESYVQERRDRRRQLQQSPSPQTWNPDLRHRGCINTACWLDVPWRLSSSAHSSNSNDECAMVVRERITNDPFHSDNWDSCASCPTQLATSGDDRVVKLWDAKLAMGSANPLQGGWDTFSPLCSTRKPIAYQAGWKKIYSENAHLKVAGAVVPLATVSTGHSRNVFHVCPISQSPGKLLTCAADGYLRIIDITKNSSSIVVNPFSNSNTEGFAEVFSLSAGLAFSHVMLSAQTGLLCSERGLHLFDLRLPSSEQPRQSLLANGVSDAADNDSESVSSESYSTSDGCKACAIWKPSAAETSAHYVFAGGSGAFVDLYDLRMDGSQKKVVERYAPRNVGHPENLAVSGLDISKDGKELLVSYESDQVYAFPILGRNEGSHLDPTLDDINDWSIKSRDRAPTAEACTYGGHLNRFTFLKNAKYAGPHDEYICTGSDSGHAWIMERASGTCVSLLSADSSTCNGVIPHPTLPFFITYGIDSSARIWRATTSVDPDVSMSRISRKRCLQEERYEMSPVTQSTKAVQMLCSRYSVDGPGILPDFIASRQEISSSGKFSSPNRRGMIDYESPRIGNSLRSLHSILRSNRYECYRSAHQGMGTPVECDVEAFSLRVSLHRLKLQATRLGVDFKLDQKPWNFGGVSNTHAADLVPDYPSDWILLDRQMTPSPIFIDSHHLNWQDWKEYLVEREPRLIEFDGEGSVSWEGPVWLCDNLKEDSDDLHWPVRESLQCKKQNFVLYFSNYSKARSRSLLYRTARVLKEGGNEALKDGHFDTAARRYDKSIQYCSIAFFNYHEGEDRLHHLKDGINILSKEKGRQAIATPAVWSPLLRILITSRLNMALLLLRPRFANIPDSISQSLEALRLLGPFTARCGAVVVSTNDLREDPDDDKDENFVFEDEPETTYHEARALQAKAFFRLGSAEMEQGDWSAAVNAFQASIHSCDKPDSLVIRRLEEAKAKRSAKKKRDRKKFEFSFRDD